jgi:hypothetical protein
VSTDYYSLDQASAAALPGVTRLERTQDCGSYRWGHMPHVALGDLWLMAKYKCRNRARWQVDYRDGASRVVCWKHLAPALQSRELDELMPRREER